MAVTAVGLKTHIYNNNVKSILLLSSFPLLILGMVFVFYLILHLIAYADDPAFSGWDKTAGSWESMLAAAPYILPFIGIWFIIAYFFHSKIIHKTSGSINIDRKTYPKIYNMLENLCISRGMAVPQFRIIDSPALNAFASGLNDKTYAITLTRGIIEALEDEELEAVIAHELSHIINKDVRLLVVSVIFVGIISFLAQLAFRMIIGGGRRSHYIPSSGSRKGGGQLIILLIALAVLVVGYIFALLIRFSLSKKREFLADAGAIELTKNPQAMMQALMRISGHDEVQDMPNEIQQMCIENSHSFMGMFATHPPIDKRIKTISEMTGTPVPTLPVSLKRPPKRPWG